ncbi:MAG: IS1595 family transposase, partial [Treponema sp.]|nr:IS1595 family transposase [Treponema sp.]
MVHTIRFAMGERDKKYLLNGMVEMDGSFFGAATEGRNRGRGTEQTAVLVSVSLTDRGTPNYARMHVLETVDGKAVTGFSKAHIGSGSE